MGDKKGLRGFLDNSTFGRFMNYVSGQSDDRESGDAGTSGDEKKAMMAELSRVGSGNKKGRQITGFTTAAGQRRDVSSMRSSLLAAELGEARTFMSSHLKSHEHFYDLLRTSEEHLMKTYTLLITHKAEKTGTHADKFLKVDISELKSTLCSLIDHTSSVKGKLKLRIGTLRSRQDVLNALIGKKTPLERTVGSRVAEYLSNCTFSSIQSRETYDDFEFITVLLRAKKKCQETQKSNTEHYQRRYRRLQRAKAGGVWLGGEGASSKSPELHADGHKTRSVTSSSNTNSNKKGSANAHTKCTGDHAMRPTFDDGVDDNKNNADADDRTDFVDRLIHQAGMIIKQWKATLDSILARLRASTQHRATGVRSQGSMALGKESKNVDGIRSVDSHREVDETGQQRNVKAAKTAVGGAANNISKYYTLNSNNGGSSKLSAISSSAGATISTTTATKPNQNARPRAASAATYGDILSEVGSAGGAAAREQDVMSSAREAHEEVVKRLKEQIRHAQLQHDRSISDMRQEFSRQLAEHREGAMQSSALALSRHREQVAKLEAEVRMLRTQVEAASTVQASLEEQNLQLRKSVGKEREKAMASKHDLKLTHKQEIDKLQRRYRRQLDKSIQKEQTKTKEELEQLRTTLQKKESEVESLRSEVETTKQIIKAKDVEFKKALSNVEKCASKRQKGTREEYEEKIKKKQSESEQLSSRLKGEVSALKKNLAMIEKQSKERVLELSADVNAFRQAFEASREHSRNLKASNELLYVHAIAKVHRLQVSHQRRSEFQLIERETNELQQKIQVLEEKTSKRFEQKIQKFYVEAEARRRAEEDKVRQRQATRLAEEKALKERAVKEAERLIRSAPVARVFLHSEVVPTSMNNDEKKTEKKRNVAADTTTTATATATNTIITNATDDRKRGSSIDGVSPSPGRGDEAPITPAIARPGDRSAAVIPNRLLPEASRNQQPQKSGQQRDAGAHDGGGSTSTNSHQETKTSPSGDNGDIRTKALTFPNVAMAHERESGRKDAKTHTTGDTEKANVSDIAIEKGSSLVVATRVRTKYGNGDIIHKNSDKRIISVRLSFGIGYFSDSDVSFEAAAASSPAATPTTTPSSVDQQGTTKKKKGYSSAIRGWFRRKATNLLTARANTATAQLTVKEQVTLEFDCSSLGLTCTGNEITSVKPGGQAQDKGVKVGWRIIMVANQQVSPMGVITAIRNAMNASKRKKISESAATPRIHITFVWDRKLPPEAKDHNSRGSSRTSSRRSSPSRDQKACEPDLTTQGSREGCSLNRSICDAAVPPTRAGGAEEGQSNPFEDDSDTDKSRVTLMGSLGLGFKRFSWRRGGGEDAGQSFVEGKGAEKNGDGNGDLSEKIEEAIATEEKEGREGEENEERRGVKDKDETPSAIEPKGDSCNLDAEGQEIEGEARAQQGDREKSSKGSGPEPESS